MAHRKPTITANDLNIIRSALSYAVADRSSFMDAMRGCSDDPAFKRAKASVENFEKLNQKLFGEPTHHTQMVEEDRAAPKVSIFDLTRSD
jgi:hypothetical protein